MSTSPPPTRDTPPNDSTLSGSPSSSESPTSPLDTRTSDTRTVVRGTGVVSILTLLSRALGFVRDLLVARLFGASPIADAFFVAFRIPNLLRSFVAEGALSAAFVPVFTSELKAGRAAAQNALSEVTTLLLLATVFLSVLGILFSDSIVALFAPGFAARPEQLRLCTLLTQIMFPYICFVSLIAMLNGALNSVKVFGAAAWAQVVMNLALIAGAVIAGWFQDSPAAIVLAISVLVGGIVQVLAQLPALERAGLSLRPARRFWSTVTRELLRLMVPALIGATIYQLNIFLNTVLASLLGTGAVSWLFYADRLTQLPIGIFSIALASVLLPTLSQAHADSNENRFNSHLVNALRYTSFVIIPLASLLAYFAHPLTALIFERGKFSPADTAQTALVVQGLSLGLWAVSCHSMLARACMARKDTVTPTLVGAGGLIVTLVGSLLLMGAPEVQSEGTLSLLVRHAQNLLSRVFPSFDFAQVGLSLSSSVSSFCTFGALSFLLSRRVPKIPWLEFASGTLRTLFSTATALGICHLCLPFLVPIPGLGQQSPGFFPLLAFLSAGGAMWLFGFLGINFLLRSREQRETLNALSALWRKRS